MSTAKAVRGRVTIMIPTFNQAHIVGDAIKSALRQDYSDLEVVISDDASTDATPQVVRAFRTERRLRSFRNTYNLGRVHNYRKSLYERATGTWVLNLDADDYLIEDDFISRAMEYVQSDPTLVAVFGGQRTVDSAHNVIVDHLPTNQAWQTVDGRSFFLDWDAYSVRPHLAALYNRELALNLDFYRANILSADWESLRRLVLRGNVLVHGRPVGAWRGHTMNASKHVSASQAIENELSITAPRKDAEVLGLSSHLLGAWYARARVTYFLKATGAVLTDGDSRGCEVLWRHVRETHPDIFPQYRVRVLTDVRLLAKYLASVVLGKEAAKRLLAAYASIRRSGPRS